jgi:hypothetical protein
VILSTYRSLGWVFTFEHVKSHQDDSIQIEDLPLAVRLNVEADRLATEYLETSEYQGHAPLFPSAKCQLVIDGDTISRKMPNAIRFKAGAGPLQDYLRTRNSWTQDVLDSIAWPAHGAAHSYHQQQKCFLIKLCHRHLPLGHTIHRRDNKYPEICPGCRTEVETHDHFLSCNAAPRIVWRTQLHSAIARQLTFTKTNTELHEAILDVIDRAIAGRPISVGGTFAAALRAQEQIGWRSMLQGYWASEWQTAYSNTFVPPMEETPAERSKRITNMARWQTQLIRTIWTSMIALWKLRNDDRHGRDAETKELARHEVLTNELRGFYINRDQYPATTRNLLRPSFEVHCQDKASLLEDWLDAYRVTFNVMHIRPNG